MDIVKYLTELPKVDMNIQVNNRTTPHMRTVDKSNPKMVIYQLQKGGDPLIKTHKRHMALHFAAENGNFDNAKLLIENK